MERSQLMGTDIQRRLFTVREYYRLAETGILNEDDHVELIDGEIVKMTPIGSAHAGCVNRLNALLQKCFGGRGIVSVQNPIRLDAYTEPQPDLSVLSPRDDSYAAGHPGPEDVLLVVEVADSSLQYDRDVKTMVYAAAGIPEMWLVDLKGEHVDVFTSPQRTHYATRWRSHRGQRVLSTVLLTDPIDVDAILPSA
jgi:Uma2 family endonuclease